MSGISTSVPVAANNGTTFANVSYPTANAGNPTGAGDKLLLIVGYGSPTGVVPPTPTGYTKMGTEVYGGANAFGLKDGPRGIVVFEKTALTTGSESGTFVLNNGATGTGCTIRYVHARISLDGATSFGTTSVTYDDDSTIDAVAPFKMFIQPGTNPSGVSSGDLVMAAGCWAQSDNANTLGSQTVRWPGAVTTGSSTGTSTGVGNGGNFLRLNVYQSPAIGAGTGNLEAEWTFSAGVAGVGATIVVKGVGAAPVADPGPELFGVEPGRPFTLDGSASDGDIATYTWQKESTPGSGSWSAVAGTGAIRTVTAGAAAAAHDESYRLKVTSAGAVDSAWAPVLVHVDGTTETFIDSTGVERGVIIEAVE